MGFLSMGCKGSKQATAAVAPSAPAHVVSPPSRPSKDINVEDVQPFSRDSEEQAPAKGQDDVVELTPEPEHAADTKASPSPSRRVDKLCEGSKSKTAFAAPATEMDPFMSLNSAADTTEQFHAAPAPATPPLPLSGTTSKRNMPPPNAQQSRQSLYVEDSAEAPGPAHRTQQSQNSRMAPSASHISSTSGRLPAEPAAELQQQASATSTSAAGTAPVAAPDADDPWASLQSQYKIKEQQHGHASRGPGLAPASSTTAAAAGGGRGSLKAGGSGAVIPGGLGAEQTLVLDEDEDDFLLGTRRGNNPSQTGVGGPAGAGARRSAGGLPPITAPGGAPKQAGWGQGDLAAAGTLMLGADEDYLLKDPSYSAPSAAAHQHHAMQAQASSASRAHGGGGDDDDLGFGALEAPPGINRGAANQQDVVFEDLDDLDAIVEDEMGRQGLSNKDLAAKLAQFEAQLNDDD